MTFTLSDAFQHAALVAARRMFETNSQREPIAGADGFFVGTGIHVIPAGSEKAKDMEVDGRTFVVFMEH